MCFVAFVLLHTAATRHTPQGGRIVMKSSNGGILGMGGRGFPLPIKGLKPPHAASFITSQSVALTHSSGVDVAGPRDPERASCRRGQCNSSSGIFLKPLCLSLTSHLAALLILILGCLLGWGRGHAEGNLTHTHTGLAGAIHSQTPPLLSEATARRLTRGEEWKVPRVHVHAERRRPRPVTKCLCSCVCLPGAQHNAGRKEHEPNAITCVTG